MFAKDLIADFDDQHSKNIEMNIKMAPGQTVLFAPTTRASKLQVELKRCSSFENTKSFTGRETNESSVNSWNICSRPPNESFSV